MTTTLLPPPPASATNETADDPPPHAGVGRLSAGRARAAEPGPLRLPTVTVGGVRLHAVTQERAVETILAELELGRGGMVVTPNLDHLYRCRSDRSFRALIEEADLTVADGMPLVWASRVRGTPLPERVAGSDLIFSLSEAAARSGRRVFLLGGEPGTAEATRAEFEQRFPGIRVVGTHCPERGFEHDTSRMARLVEALTAARPEVVFVALGSPKQERLISRLRDTLPRAWWLGVGISFSFVAGHVRRAPPWMRRWGVEWVHRLWQEPGRLAKRYLWDGLPYAGRLMAGSALARLLRRPVDPDAVGPGGGHRKIDRSRGLPTASAKDRPFDPASRLDSDANARAVEAALADGRGDGGRSASPAAGPVKRANPPRRPARPEDGADAADAADAVDVPAVLAHLRGLVLLAGRSRPGPFAAGVCRPVLELPLTRREDPEDGEDGAIERLIDGWLRAAEQVAAAAGMDWLPVRVVVSDPDDAPQFPAPPGVARRPAGSFEVSCDRAEHRGTGGVLRDLSGEYADDDLLLVYTAQQVMIDPPAAVVRPMAGRLGRGADVALVGHHDGTPGGPMLVRCRALRHISPVGYVDMKEQALPAIAARHDVRVVRTRLATTMPVRGAESYIAALQRYHAHRAGRGRGLGPHPLGVPLAEDHSRHFGIVEPGGEVDATAYLHDSVVLAGGRVEAGATVVRSVVCPGGVVKRDAQAVDAVVTRPAP